MPEPAPLPLRLLLVTLNYAPEPVGIGKYSGELGGWLASRGHRVRVITAPPYFPGWRIAAGAANRYRRELRDGAQLLRCPLWVPSRPSGFTRLLHLASFALSSGPQILRQWRWRPDVVITVAPALFCAPAALLLRRLCGCRTVLHIQDFELDAAFELGLLRGGWLRWLAEGWERTLLQGFDRVSSISAAMVRRLAAKGVAPERTWLLPNWVHLAGNAEASTQQAALAFRQALVIGPDQLVLLYSGSMNRKQGLELLVEVIRGLQHRQDLVWVLAGEGPGREQLERACADLPQVRLSGLQPPERLEAWLAMADVHLLPQKAEATDLVLPSKLIGMLASSRPLISTSPAGSDLAAIAAEAGLCVPPGDAAALQEAVERLCGDPALRQQRGERARQLAAEHFDRERLLPAFEQQLRELVAR